MQGTGRRQIVVKTPVGTNPFIKQLLEAPPGNCTTAAARTKMHPKTADEQRQAAKEICSGCPILLTCLVSALDGGENAGVLGGKTERERKALKKLHPEVTSWEEYFSPELSLINAN
jgi:hypothetical protein